MADFNLSYLASELNEAITKAKAAAPQSTTYTKTETDALLADKPGEITTGKQYVIGGQTVTAGTGAEAFNALAHNKAAGQYSHAEGDNTTASGNSSHAEGSSTTASGTVSHAEGEGTKASSAKQHVQGKFNVEDANGTYAFIIGNGTADNARHNAFAIDWNGLIYVNGAATGVNVATLAADLAALTARVEAIENQ